MASKTDQGNTMSKLPPKDATMFGQLVACFEKKEFKKGIKLAETILKKYPEHADTLAMKGIICSSMGDKTTAHDLLKRASTLNNDSYLVWHVYGLLYKHEQNYILSSEAFKRSLAIDKHNANVAKDLSFLQVQVRIVLSDLSIN